MTGPIMQKSAPAMRSKIQRVRMPASSFRKRDRRSAAVKTARAGARVGMDPQILPRLESQRAAGVASQPDALSIAGDADPVAREEVTKHRLGLDGRQLVGADASLIEMAQVGERSAGVGQRVRGDG